VKGYKNQFDRFALPPITHFVTFIYSPNIAATSSPPSLSNTPSHPKRDKTSGLRTSSSCKLSPPAVFFSSQAHGSNLASLPRPTSSRIRSRSRKFGVTVLFCHVILSTVLCNYIYCRGHLTNLGCMNKLNKSPKGKCWELMALVSKYQKANINH